MNLDPRIMGPTWLSQVTEFGVPDDKDSAKKQLFSRCMHVQKLVTYHDKIILIRRIGLHGNAKVTTVDTFQLFSPIRQSPVHILPQVDYTMNVQKPYVEP